MTIVGACIFAGKGHMGVYDVLADVFERKHVLLQNIANIKK